MWRLLIRFVFSAMALLCAGLLIPDFRPGGLTVIFLDAILIALVVQFIQSLLGRGVSPGLAGFIVSAPLIYLSGAVLPGMRLNLTGVLLSALFIGAADTFMAEMLR